MKLHEDFISSLVLPVLGPQTPSQIFTRIKVYQILSTTFIIKKSEAIYVAPQISPISPKKLGRTVCNPRGTILTRHWEQRPGSHPDAPPPDNGANQPIRWQHHTNRCHCPFATNTPAHLGATQKRTSILARTIHPDGTTLIRTLSTTWQNTSYQPKDKYFSDFWVFTL